MFKPTFLYIKQHTITGKLYFGKTTGNPEKYNGSGKYWADHINKHGKEHVVNLWYCLFYDEQDCKEFALSFSKQQNIVESKEWANLIEENGIDGISMGTKIMSDYQREIIRKRNKQAFIDGTHPWANRSIKGELNPNWGKKHPGLNKGTKYSEESKLKMKAKKAGKKPAMLTITNQAIGCVSVDDPRWETGEIISLKGGLTGKIWITNGEITLSHNATHPIPNGFRRGRK